MIFSVGHLTEIFVHDVSELFIGKFPGAFFGAHPDPIVPEENLAPETRSKASFVFRVFVFDSVDNMCHVGEHACLVSAAVVCIKPTYNAVIIRCRAKVTDDPFVHVRGVLFCKLQQPNEIIVRMFGSIDAVSAMSMFAFTFFGQADPDPQIFEQFFARFVHIEFRNGVFGDDDHFVCIIDAVTVIVCLQGFN